MKRSQRPLLAVQSVSRRLTEQEGVPEEIALRRCYIASNRKLSVKTMTAFGIGDTAGAFLSMAERVTLLFCYQQVVRVDAALVGLAIAIATMVDAVSDPIVGTWSDRVVSRWGRRHPMLLLSTIPLGLNDISTAIPSQSRTRTQVWGRWHLNINPSSFIHGNFASARISDPAAKPEPT